MSSELQELFRGHLHNITEENQSGTSLHLPSIFTYLPHLTGHPESLKPKYHLSKNKFGGKKISQNVKNYFKNIAVVGKKDFPEILG